MAGWEDKSKIMQRYDATAQGYDELYAQEQKEKYMAALENVAVTGTVLDVGCGSGLFFREVTAKADMVVGVDISRKLLLKAKQQADAFGNVWVLQADADHLPFKDGLFDVVFAFTIIQNMPNPSAIMGEFKRVTKPAGRVVVTGLKRVFSLTAFLDLLEASGLTVVSFVDKEDLKCYVSVLMLNI